MLPVAVYGLEVPAGDVIVPAVPDFPATVSYAPETYSKRFKMLFRLVVSIYVQYVWDSAQLTS